MIEALAVGAIFPAIILVLSLAVRFAVDKSLPASAGADWLILLITFDVGAAYAKDELVGLVNYHPFHAWFSVILICLAACSTLIWLFAAFWIEPKLRRRPRAMSLPVSLVDRFERCKICLFYVSWTIALALTSFHIFPFVYGS